MKKNSIISKQIPFLAAMFLLVLMIAAPFSRTSANSLTTVDLSGSWTFTPQGGSATTIQVPGGGWYKQGFTSVNEADYQRTITIPNTGQPQVTKVEFGAINYEASLYINNNLVATQRTSFTPSVFDITNFVTPGNSYTLKVHVKGKNAMMSGGKSLVPNAAGWSPNTPQGIFRSAQIVVYPQIYINDVFVRPSVQNTNFSYDVWVTNASSSSHTMTISSNLTSWNGTSFSYPGIGDQSFTINANTTSKITIGPISWGLGTASYWWPNVPYQSGYTAQLHNLNLTLKESGATKDSKSVRFGFKEVVQKSDGTNTNYYLNGIRVNFRGDSFQGANYDAITYGGGKSDAFDTFPGFLPGTNGWPKAVDNIQRLNYNFVRIHQEPASPYMLDVCDEKGLMVMDETAIRGSSNDQDFSAGHDNMVNHLIALFTRDRNHPSIVRWSQCNEPDFSSTDSNQFQIDLYNATMSVDNTRPISIDPYGNFYNSLTYSNFSTFRHYANGIGAYTDEVSARTDRPYGQGEFIWNKDNTKQGFTWFATSTQEMRWKNASDIRPYTLLSAWASVIPGVRTTDMVIEQGGNSIYGENNLSDPWSNYQIQRVQAGFNPVLVADGDYWSQNKLSDSNGNWPVTVPSFKPNTGVTRTLHIYNDTFSGTTVDVYWELRRGSATGTLSASGELHPTIALGSRTSQNISFTTPNVADGTRVYLVLYSKKSGVELFRENSEYFTISSNASPWQGTYKVVNRNSGKLLDVYGQSTDDGANVNQWGDNGGANQRWQIVDIGGGYYEFVNQNSGKALDVNGNSTDDGANVQQWAYGGGANQQWQIVDIGGGYYKIVNRNSGKLLDVYGQSTADGGNVDQWTDNGGTNQQWQIINVNGTSSGAPIGKNISLKCVANNYYVCSENGTANMNCNRSSAGIWETFQVVDAGNGNIALKGYANNAAASAYVCSENGTAAMNCNRTSIGAWETFTWVANSDGTVSLKGNNGMYVNGSSPMWCNWGTIDSTVKFQVTIY